MSKTPIKIAAVVFLLVGLLHLARLLLHFDVTINGWAVPLWVNGIGVLIALPLSFWLFKTLKS